MHASNSIIKFADDTTVAYREEVRALGVWCQENNLTLNVNKTKEMIVDFRKQQREQPRIYIDGTVVERVESFEFLSVHIKDKLKWSTHTDSVVKKAQFRKKKFGLPPKTLTHFYRCTIESILSVCITAWYDICSAHNRKTLQRVVHPAIIQKARSVQVHQRGDQETEKQLLSQGHQTVKQPSLTLSGCCQHNDSAPATLIIEKWMYTSLPLYISCLHTLHYSSHMYILYAILSTASCHLDVIKCITSHSK
jgi:hypothetical protein